MATMQFSSRPDWMELDMTMAQIKALFTISQGEAVPVNRIAEYLGVGQPTASHLVDKLVRQGFAGRSESATDRRVTLVRLTLKGEDLVRRLYQGGEEQYRSWVKQLTGEERKNLLSGLQALDRVASMRAQSYAVGTNKRSLKSTYRTESSILGLLDASICRIDAEPGLSWKMVIHKGSVKWKKKLYLVKVVLKCHVWVSGR
jgi:DNA-binding MarR family transcriptional regulator